MRVLLFSYGNIEYTIALANALSRNPGMHVILMEPLRRINAYRELVAPGVEVQTFKPYRIRNPMNLGLACQIVRRFKKLNADVIHIQRGHPWLNLLLFCLRKVPLVVTIHDVTRHPGDDASKLTSFVNRMIIHFADKIIVHGEYLRAKVIKSYKKKANQVYSIMRGDYRYFYEYHAENCLLPEGDQPYVLFFGRIWGYKGLEYLIKAEPFITNKIPEAKIVIAGTGENLKKYTEMMVNRKQFIILNTRIPETQVFDLFKKATIVVLPYTEASQSGVVPLAYAMKKPVVVSRVGSLPEAVENGITGLVVEPKDSAQLAEGIIYLLERPETIKWMGENGYAKTKNEHSWENMALATARVYKEVVDFKRVGVSGGKRNK